MHPIEHLRYVARAGDGLPQDVLVEEAAYALADLSDTPSELVMACRRLLQRHSNAGAMWTLAARVCVAADPPAAALDLVRQMRSDPTISHVAQALPTSDVALIEALAAGPDGIVAAAGSYATATVARAFDIQVWAIVVAGRALPAVMFEAFLTQNQLERPDQTGQADQTGRAEEIIPFGLITHLARPDGIHSLEQNPADLLRYDCPPAAELLTPLT